MRYVCLLVLAALGATAQAPPKALTPEAKEALRQAQVNSLAALANLNGVLADLYQTEAGKRLAAVQNTSRQADEAFQKALEKAFKDAGAEREKWDLSPALDWVARPPAKPEVKK